MVLCILRYSNTLGRVWPGSGHTGLSCASNPERLRTPRSSHLFYFYDALTNVI